MSYVARATPWGSIQVGEMFQWLTPDEQIGVLAHETGHIEHDHAFKRLLWVISLRAVFQPEKYFKMCEEQEYEADAFAKSEGCAEGLASFLHRCSHGKALGYPRIHDRIKRLQNG